MFGWSILMCSSICFVWNNQPTSQTLHYHLVFRFVTSIKQEKKTPKKNDDLSTPSSVPLFCFSWQRCEFFFTVLPNFTILVSCPNITSRTKQKMSGAFWSLTPLCYFQKNIIIMNCNQKLHHFLSFCFLFLHPKVSTDQSKIFVCVCEIFCNRM